MTPRTSDPLGWVAGQIAAMPKTEPREANLPAAIREVVEIARKHGRISSRIVAHERGMRGLCGAHRLLVRAHKLGVIRRIDPPSNNMPVFYVLERE